MSTATQLAEQREALIQVIQKQALDARNAVEMNHRAGHTRGETEARLRMDKALDALLEFGIGTTQPAR